jgi:hypothetical protein
LNKIKIAEWWSGDRDTRAILHRIHCDLAQFGLAVSKIKLTFFRQIRDAMLAQHPADIFPCML